eukprot:scaffold3416_cov78-Skeletonema_dohrnii-CCMP3373.AAC.1
MKQTLPSSSSQPQLLFCYCSGCLYCLYCWSVVIHLYRAMSTKNNRRPPVLNSREEGKVPRRETCRCVACK